MLYCSACNAARRVKASFRPQPRPNADVEAKRREQHERKLADERRAWAEMYERRATPA
jgi:hypothetical protein